MKGRLRQMPVVGLVIVFTARVSGQDLFDHTLYPLPWLSSPRSIVAADLDSDGDVDLAVTTLRPRQIVFFDNPGDGNLVSGGAVAVADLPIELASGDLDGDGDVDLLVGETNFPIESIEFLRNDGGVFISVGRIQLRSQVAGVAAVPFDGDLLSDVVVSENGDPSRCSFPAPVRVYHNDGAFSFHQISYSLSGCAPSRLALGDIDGIHGVDLMTADSQAGQITMYLNDGHGGLVPGGTLPLSGPVRFVHGADLDGNGSAEVIAAADQRFFNQTEITVLWNGVPGGSQRVDYGHYSKPGPITSGDFDGDGYPDIAIANNLSVNLPAQLTVLRGVTGHRFSSGVSSLSGGDPWQSLVAELDPNSLGPEIVFVNGFTDSISVHRRTSSPWPEIELRIDPSAVFWTVQVRIVAGGGLPGTHCTLYAVEINGAPANVPVHALTFDSSGEAKLEFEVPKGLTGLQMKFAVFGPDHTGRFSRSNNAEMVFQ